MNKFIEYSCRMTNEEGIEERKLAMKINFESYKLIFDFHNPRHRGLMS